MLRITVVRDHRPGHYNQSEGVVLALKRLAPVSVDYVDLKRRAVPSWHLIYSLYGSKLFSDRLFASVIYPSVDVESVPDIIVSAGGDTLLLNVLLARRYGSANIFSGSVRNLDPALFSAILTPYSRFSQQSPYISGLKPCPVDPEQVLKLDDGFDVCVLIGGPSGTHAYSREHWRHIIDLTTEIGRTASVGVFASRRTPADVFTAFEAMTAPGVTCFSANAVGTQELLAFCRRANVILVSEDSNSMITEAICCRRPVITLAPPTNRMSVDEAAYLSGLSAQGWLSRQELDGTCTASEIMRKSQSITPMTFNHLDVLAEKLEARIPQLRSASVVASPAMSTA